MTTIMRRRAHFMLPSIIPTASMECESPQARRIRRKQSGRSKVFTIVMVSAGLLCYFLTTRLHRGHPLLAHTQSITLLASDIVVANQEEASSNLPSSTPNMINFAHIPKSGGTTFELLSRKNKHVCGLWGSHMVGNVTLGKEHPWGSGFWHASAEYKNTLCKCAEWHMPPFLLPKNLLDRLYPASETFCVLRKPLDRLVSFFYYHHTGPGYMDGKRKYVEGNPCFDNTSGATYMNEILKRDLTKALQEPCWFGCHLLPQTLFMKGFVEDPVATITRDAPSRDCNHVLLLDRNLSTQFNNLMSSASVGCPIRLPEQAKRVNSNSGARNVCSKDPDLFLNQSLHMLGKKWSPFTVADLDEDVVALARELYHEDFRLYDQMVANTDMA